MNDALTEYSKISVAGAAGMIANAKRMLILFHVHPDGDATGSAFALRDFAVSFGKEAVCVCADELPERLQFIAANVQESVLVDSVPEMFDPDLIVSVDTASPSQLGNLYELYKDKIDLMIDHHGKGTVYADYCIEHTASDRKSVV